MVKRKRSQLGKDETEADCALSWLKFIRNINISGSVMIEFEDLDRNDVAISAPRPNCSLLLLYRANSLEFSSKYNE